MLKNYCFKLELGFRFCFVTGEAYQSNVVALGEENEMIFSTRYEF